MDRRRGSRLTRAASVVVALVLASGCVGSPASTKAWQSSSHRTLGTVISGLGTARIAVSEDVEGDLPHSYAVVSVTDAIDTSSKEVASYLVSQPPDRLHRANATVTRALHDGVALLVDVRVALASPGLTDSSARRLLSSIDDLRDRLDKLDSDVEKAPETVGAQ